MCGPLSHCSNVFPLALGDPSVRHRPVNPALLSRLLRTERTGQAKAGLRAPGGPSGLHLPAASHPGSTAPPGAWLEGRLTAQGPLGGHPGRLPPAPRCLLPSGFQSLRRHRTLSGVSLATTGAAPRHCEKAPGGGPLVSPAGQPVCRSPVAERTIPGCWKAHSVS